MKIPPEDCFEKVKLALVAEDDLLAKRAETKFCVTLDDDDYKNISRELRREVDLVQLVKVRNAGRCEKFRLLKCDRKRRKVLKVMLQG